MLSCITINNNFTDCFNVIMCGLKQGCISLQLLFSIFYIFIIDLIDDIKRLNIGINIDNDKVYIILYADDVVHLFLTENEND